MPSISRWVIDKIQQNSASLALFSFRIAVKLILINSNRYLHIVQVPLEASSLFPTTASLDGAQAIRPADNNVEA